MITKYIHKIIPDICLKILKATLPRALQPQDTQCFLVGIGRLTDLQNAILRAFPDVVFDGQITSHDGAWPHEPTEEGAIYGDEKLLYEGLKGHKWSDIPRQFIQRMATDFVLLTSEALEPWMPHPFARSWLLVFQLPPGVIKSSFPGGIERLVGPTLN